MHTKISSIKRTVLSLVFFSFFLTGCNNSKLDYSINNYKSIKSSASDSIKELSGENVLFKLSNIITYSTLDSFFRPTEGSILKFANRYAIDDYLSNRLSYDKFYNLNKRVFSIYRYCFSKKIFSF